MKKIKEKDEVIVIAGKDKGKRGRIKKILDAQRVIVEGVNLLKKHQKPNPQMGMAGGIIEQEAPMQISNVAIFNPSTKKADRVGIKLDGEVKSRVYKSTGAAIDS